MSHPEFTEFEDDFDGVYLHAVDDPYTPLNILHNEWGVHVITKDGKNYFLTLRGPMKSIPHLLYALKKQPLDDGARETLDFEEFTA
jgi:hypothetical protein